jgi:hypothetical protein
VLIVVGCSFERVFGNEKGGLFVANDERMKGIELGVWVL